MLSETNQKRNLIDLKVNEFVENNFNFQIPTRGIFKGCKLLSGTISESELKDKFVKFAEGLKK